MFNDFDKTLFGAIMNMIIGIGQVVIVILKFTKVIDWSWWLILLVPIGITFVMRIIYIIIVKFRGY